MCAQPVFLGSGFSRLSSDKGAMLSGTSRRPALALHKQRIEKGTHAESYSERCMLSTVFVFGVFAVVQLSATLCTHTPKEHFHVTHY